MALNCYAQRVYPLYDSLKTENIQGEQGIYAQVQRYLKSKYKRLSKQASREQRATAKLLRKLHRKEKKMLSKFSSEDSLAFLRPKP